MSRPEKLCRSAWLAAESRLSSSLIVSRLRPSRLGAPFEIPADEPPERPPLRGAAAMCVAIDGFATKSCPGPAELSAAFDLVGAGSGFAMWGSESGDGRRL